jgi:hypothetical protein
LHGVVAVLVALTLALEVVVARQMDQCLLLRQLLLLWLLVVAVVRAAQALALDLQFRAVVVLQEILVLAVRVVAILEFFFLQPLKATHD